MTQLIEFALENFGLCMLLVSVICISAQCLVHPQNKLSETIFRWVVLFPLGMTAIYAFVMHAFFPVVAAATIGWANSPFQYEVAVANLGFGIIAILCFKANFSFRLATVIGNTAWLWGDAIGHIHQMISHQNFTAGNAGSWFYLDLLIPLILMISLVGSVEKNAR